jgi:hypothetical protein
MIQVKGVLWGDTGMTGDKPSDYAVYIPLKAMAEGAEERLLGALQYLRGVRHSRKCFHFTKYLKALEKKGGCHSSCLQAADRSFARGFRGIHKLSGKANGSKSLNTGIFRLPLDKNPVS